MNAINLISILFFLFNFCNTDNLTELLDNMNGLLTDIETDKEIIYQQFSYDEEMPFNVEFIKTIEKIKDGKQKTESYLFNLALVNEKKVTIKSSKNKMTVRLETSGGKYIQKHEEGISKGYVNYVEIQSSDIDIAREINELLDDAIPAAKTAWEAAIEVPDELPALKTWIASYIDDVATEKKSWNQSREDHPVFEDYTILNVQEAGKDDMASYSFSWTDIEPKSLKVTPSGDIIKMELKTKANKRLLTKDGTKGRTFEKNFTLYFNDAASALELTKGIEKVISASATIAEEREKSYAACNECISALSTSVSAYSGKNWETSLNANCNGELNFQKVGKEEAENYAFYWSDLHAASITQDFNSSELKLAVQTTGKEKFVTKTVNGEIKGYGNKVEFLFNDLEAFRQAKYQVQKTIEGCVLELSPESIEWMNDIFASSAINEMNQTISLEEGEDCSVVFNSSKEDSDKSYAYDFNLYDIDAKRLALKFRGNKLQLELSTNKNEKIITRTNQDGKLEYTNKVVLDFDNITHLRVGKMTFEKAIGGCTKK